MEAVLLAHSQIKDVRALLVLESKFPASRLPLKTFLVLKSLTLSLNRPGFSRHSQGSLRNAFQTLPVTADC